MKGEVVTVLSSSLGHVNRQYDASLEPAQLRLCTYKGDILFYYRLKISSHWTTTITALFKEFRAFLFIPSGTRHLLISAFVRTSTSGSGVDVVQRGPSIFFNWPFHFHSLTISTSLHISGSLLETWSFWDTHCSDRAVSSGRLQAQSFVFPIFLVHSLPEYAVSLSSIIVVSCHGIVRIHAFLSYMLSRAGDWAMARCDLAYFRTAITYRADRAFVHTESSINSTWIKFSKDFKYMCHGAVWTNAATSLESNKRTTQRKCGPSWQTTILISTFTVTLP